MVMPALEVDKAIPDTDVTSPEWIPDEPWMGEYRRRLSPYLGETDLKHCQLLTIREMERVEKRIQDKVELVSTLPGLKGGILADSVGFGKTLTALAVTKLRPGSTPLAEIGTRNCRGKFLTNAQLVICPSHLIKQWESECYKHFKKGVFKKIVILDSVTTHARETYKSICRADLVICSERFFKGKHYMAISSPLFNRDVHWAKRFLIFSDDKKELEGCWRKMDWRFNQNIATSFGLKISLCMTTSRDLERTSSENAAEIRNYLVMEKVYNPVNYRWHLVKAELITEIRVSMGSQWVEETNSFVDKEVRERVQHRKLIEILYSTAWGTKDDLLRTGWGPGTTVLLMTYNNGLPMTTRKHMKRFVLPAKKRKLKECCPRLDHFVWNRVIIDEVHEFFHRPFNTQPTKHSLVILKNFESQYRWGISATPDPSPDVLIGTLQWLGSDIKCGTTRVSNCIKYKYPENFKLSMLNGTVFCKSQISDSESKLQDNEIPEQEEEIVWTSLHPYEELMHGMELMLGNEEAASRAVTNLMGAYSTMFGEDGKDLSLKNFLSRFTATIKRCTKTLTSEIKTFRAQMAVTPLDLQCKRRFYAAKRQLDEWRKRNIYLQKHGAEVMRAATKWKKRNSKIVRRLAGQEGSKFAHMIGMVKSIIEQDPQHRIILFSQHQTALRRAEKFLLTSGIPAASMMGSCHRRSRVLANFQDRYKKDGKKISAKSDCKVILVSSRFSASGSDMQYGTHIILMDPFLGTETEAYAQEKQAIGRALRQGSKELKDKVRILRFVVKGSVEAKAYARNMKVLAKMNRQRQTRITTQLTGLACKE